jgi:hypothetical protein
MGMSWGQGAEEADAWSEKVVTTFELHPEIEVESTLL